MENLEVMAEARRYNAHIAALLLGAVQATGGRDLAVDFGAGVGTFTGVVAPCFRRLIAIEVEPPSIDRLQRHGYDVHTDLASVGDASVDFVFSINVLEHIDDDVGALREIHRILRPGGSLFLYVPAFMGLWTEMDRLVGHRRRYTVPSLGTALMSAGFSSARGRYVDSLGAVASLLMRARGGDGRLSRRVVGLYDRLAFPVSRRLDSALSSLFGKNAAVVAQRP